MIGREVNGKISKFHQFPLASLLVDTSWWIFTTAKIEISILDDYSVELK